MDRRFGDPEQPLLVSVRSGARVSMPGMMDTVLNLGLNDEVAAGLARASSDERFAYDSYRRFVAMYGDVVLGLKSNDKEADPFEAILEEKKRSQGVELDTDLSAQALKDLVVEFKYEIWKRKQIRFPDDPWDQLWGAIDAVFGSWDNPRRRNLPPTLRNPFRLGHGRQRSGYGLRQPRRRLRDRRRFHPRPVDRRQPLLWRVPDQRPG